MAADPQHDHKEAVFFRVGMNVREQDGDLFAVVEAGGQFYAFGPLANRLQGDVVLRWCADILDGVLRSNGIGEMMPPVADSGRPN
jgi:hypothetical protein